MTENVDGEGNFRVLRACGRGGGGGGGPRQRNKIIIQASGGLLFYDAKSM